MFYVHINLRDVLNSVCFEICIKFTADSNDLVYGSFRHLISLPVFYL